MPTLPSGQLKNLLAQEAVERYGSSTQLLSTFNPSMQQKYCANEDRCITGSAPRLSSVRDGWGRDVAILWLSIQLRDLSEYAGCKDKMSIHQMEDLAGVILSEYGGLKLTEVMLFFHRFKAGAYGSFYGSVDAMVVASALKEFKAQRDNKLYAIHQKQMQEAKLKQEQEHSQKIVSYEEYLRLKATANA